MKKTLFNVVRSMLLIAPFGRIAYAKACQYRERRRKLRDQKILQSEGPDLLRLVHERLHGRVPYFIDFGTLLGCVREGSFIKHDDDVDFGIMPGGDLRFLMELLDGTELKYNGSYVYDGEVREVGYTFRKMRVDFFVCSEEGDVFFTDQYYDVPGRKYGRHETGCYRLSRPKISGIEEREFACAVVNVPVNCEDLLAAYYGKGWRCPDPEWKAEAVDGRYQRVLMPGVGRFAVPKEEALSLCRRMRDM